MKGKINFIIDALMFLLMALVTGLGFLMKYVLVPGKDRISRFGRQVDLYFWNLDRHEWGNIHLILGFVLLGLLVLHILLHWSAVLCLYRRLIGSKARRRILALLFSLLCVFLLVFPFLVSIEIEEIKPGQGHHAEVQPDPSGPDGKGRMIGSVSQDDFMNTRKTATLGKPGFRGESSRREEDIRIQGFMPIQQVSARYGVPMADLLAGLAIKGPVDPAETLGHLKKKVAFRMSDVEDLIRRYRREKSG
ncbi:DUF4405 domain-containing protein [bacterium]|nr:DUF4405 domain-containing protein [bacterium]